MEQNKLYIKTFHNDDLSLKLVYPENLGKFTSLNDEEFTNTFEIFARILFDNLLTKDRKSFQIQYDEISNKWIYIFESQMPKA